MATITVTLTDNQVVGAKDHFGTQDNAQALALFREWVANHANCWYTDYQKKDLDAIQAALLADMSKVPAAKAAIGI